MCGERRAADDNVRVFWDYIDAVNYAGTPRFDSIMKVFPFIRYLPGPYGRACKRLEELREKLIDLFLQKQKVCLKYSYIILLIFDGEVSSSTLRFGMEILTVYGMHS